MNNLKILTQRRWDLVEKAEKKAKASFLRSLSPRQSVKIYWELYSMVNSFADKRIRSRFNEERFKSLLKMRALFNP